MIARSYKKIKQHVKNTVNTSVKASGATLSTDKIDVLNKLVYDHTVFHGDVDTNYVNRLVTFAARA